VKTSRTDVSGAIARMDAFVNALTGAGGADDKGSRWNVSEVYDTIPFGHLQSAYRAGTYVPTLVDLPADDATSGGINVTNIGDRKNLEDPRWMIEDTRLGVLSALNKAVKFSRAYGTGYIIPITVDDRPLDKALNMESIVEISQILILTPHECVKQDVFANEYGASPVYEPATYTLALPSLSMTLPSKWSKALQGAGQIHASRVIPITGNDLSITETHEHWALGHSVLQAAWSALGRMEGVDSAASFLAQEMKMDVVRISDLAAIATGDSAALFQQRLQLLKQGKSYLGLIALGEGEDYESRAAPVAGFKDLTQTCRDALVAASRIPEAIWLAKASSGLATAPGTEQLVYERLISNIRTHKVAPAALELYRMIAAAKNGPFKGDIPNIRISFPPLIPESPKDVAARELIVGQRDATYVGMLSGVDPDAARAMALHLVTNRYSDNGFAFAIPGFEYEADETPPPAAPPTPSNAVLGGNAPKAPGGQPPGRPPAPPKIGGPGISVDPMNTGKGLLDAKFPPPSDEDRKRRYKVPESAKNNALKALRWRDEHKPQAGTPTGWGRARQLAADDSIPGSDIITMAAWFARHAENAQLNPEYRDEPWRDAGYLMWLAWGGDSARTWVEKARAAMGRTDAPKGSDPKTPALPSERIRGSEANPEGSAKNKSQKIELSEAVEQSLRNKAREHNEKYPNSPTKRTSASALKAVWRRGAGAFSVTHRPGMTRQQWAMGRVNAFLHLLRTGNPKNPKYIGDNDLLPKGHPKNRRKQKRKDALPCPKAAKDIALNTRNRNITRDEHAYGPLNPMEPSDMYWRSMARKWEGATVEEAKATRCGNCAAFDVSWRMRDCLPMPGEDGPARGEMGEVDEEMVGREAEDFPGMPEDTKAEFGFCWMHNFKCHSARTCDTHAAGGPIVMNYESEIWQKKGLGPDSE
jgi:phage-related protein (TIGR01555 family)